MIHRGTTFELELPDSWEPVGERRFVDDGAELRVGEGAPPPPAHQLEQELPAKIAGRQATLRFERDGDTLLFRAGFEGDELHLAGTCPAADAATHAPTFVSAAHSLRFPPSNL